MDSITRVTFGTLAHVSKLVKAAPEVVSTVKGVTVASITAAKDAIDTTKLCEDVQASVMKVATKSQDLIEAAPGAAKQGAEWAAGNPGTAVLAVVGVTGAVLVAAPMAAAAPAMALGGFSSVGPVAGSFAAGAQAAAGNVVAGGAFATVQSAAMGGYGVAAVSGVVQGLGATMITAAGVGYQKSKM